MKYEKGESRREKGIWWEINCEAGKHTAFSFHWFLKAFIQIKTIICGNNVLIFISVVYEIAHVAINLLQNAIKFESFATGFKMPFASHSSAVYAHYVWHCPQLRVPVTHLTRNAENPFHFNVCVMAAQYAEIVFDRGDRQNVSQQ
jgi:hypothetical protein